MKCTRCGDRATVELRRHNAAFCVADFLAFFRRQVSTAIGK
ncbi:MAG: tRNA(Ile)-lysidine synthetase, partial [Candidatus Rokuibacteriota bacterium]